MDCAAVGLDADGSILISAVDSRTNVAIAADNDRRGMTEGIAPTVADHRDVGPKNIQEFDRT